VGSDLPFEGSIPTVRRKVVLVPRGNNGYYFGGGVICNEQ
jgi:hypothetical protein